MTEKTYSRYRDPYFYLWMIVVGAVTGWVTWTTTLNLETIERRTAINSIPDVVKEMVLLRLDVNANTRDIKTLDEGLKESVKTQDKLDKRQWDQSQGKEEDAGTP